MSLIPPSHEVSPPLSRAIGLARILLVIGLVFLHYGTFPNSALSPFQGMDIHAHRFATWVNSAVLFFFFSSVPLLSLISGWLFFSFPPEKARTMLKKRLWRRFTSLYLPLVVWNLGYLALLYAVFVLQPQSSLFSHQNRFAMDFHAAGWMDYVNAVFAIQKEPVAFQFWFVRDLFVTVLVSPLLWLALRSAPWAGAAALCLVWLGGWNLGIFIRADVPFFFYMGGLVRQKQLPLIVSARAAYSLLALFTALACLRALVPYLVPVGTPDPLWLEVATRAMRVPGVIGCWGVMYRLAQTRWGMRASTYGGLAFFLHSAHWPLLAVVKAAVAHVIPVSSDLGMLLHYLFSVALTVMIGLAGGLFLARRLPAVFALMNGGRLLSQAPAAPPAEPEPVLEPAVIPIPVMVEILPDEAA